jgi:flagellar hook assembly protein FlgD
MPTRMELAPSYPNPFNNSLTVVLGMPKTGTARLVVFDILGRAVRHLRDGSVAAGWTRVIWDGRSDDGVALAPGSYLIRLSAEGRVVTKSVKLVR